MTNSGINFEKYIALHNSGIPISRVKPITNQTFHILKNCNVDVRIIDRDKNLKVLYNLEQLLMFSKDTVKYSHRYFYSIPLQTVKGTIIGFIYRTVFGKAYTTVSRTPKDVVHKVPYMFGFFKDFEDFDIGEQCKPIVVCEGLKDCITLKKIYPYVVSNNTNQMGLNLQVLSNLTNKFILIYDNDKAGEEGTITDLLKIKELKYDAVRLRISRGYKDITDCSENPEEFQKIREELLSIIDRFSNNSVNISSLGRTYL